MRKRTMTGLQLRGLNLKLHHTALSWERTHNRGIGLVFQLSLRFQAPLNFTHLFLPWRRVL